MFWRHAAQGNAMHACRGCENKVCTQARPCNVCLLWRPQEGDASAGPLEDACAELAEAPRELAELYNDYAAPWRAWGLALRMVALAGYSDAGYVRQLWDVYLRQARAAVVPCPHVP